MFSGEVESLRAFIAQHLAVSGTGRYLSDVSRHAFVAVLLLPERPLYGFVLGNLIPKPMRSARNSGDVYDYTWPRTTMEASLGITN